MTITRKYLEKYSERTRDFKDARKFIARAIFSYFSHNGDEYRKSFTAPQGTPEETFWKLAPITMEIDPNDH